MVLFFVGEEIRLNLLPRPRRLSDTVVETGLVLLGTSWLSALSNTALKRFKANQQPPRYVLDISDRNNLVRTRLWDERKTLHLYIFTIGII